MVLFPVLYGLCQLGEVFVATGLFQAWVFAHRHDVTEEAITSVVDTSVLTSIPVPAHKDSPVSFSLVWVNLVSKPYSVLTSMNSLYWRRTRNSEV